jgi:hypothetical protein
MCLERILRTAAFVVASLASVTALGITIDYLSLLSAQAR